MTLSLKNQLCKSTEIPPSLLQRTAKIFENIYISSPAVQIWQLYTTWAVQKDLWLIQLQITSKEYRVPGAPLPAQPSLGIFTSLLPGLHVLDLRTVSTDRTTCAGDAMLHNCELLPRAVQGWDSTTGGWNWPCLHPPIALPWRGELWYFWCHLEIPGTWLLKSVSCTEIFSVWFFLWVGWGFLGFYGSTYIKLFWNKRLNMWAYIHFPMTGFCFVRLVCDFAFFLRTLRHSSERRKARPECEILLFFFFFVNL